MRHEANLKRIILLLATLTLSLILLSACAQKGADDSVSTDTVTESVESGSSEITSQSEQADNAVTSAETTDKDTVTVPQTITSTIPNHTECNYCGKLDNHYRWFIAVASDSASVKPVGVACPEATSALKKDITLHYSIVNGKEDKFADQTVVLVVYNGMIGETYPAQIWASYVEYHGDLEKTVEAAKNIKSSTAYKELMEKVESKQNQTQTN